MIFRAVKERFSLCCFENKSEAGGDVFTPAQPQRCHSGLGGGDEERGLILTAEHGRENNT